MLAAAVNRTRTIGVEYEATVPLVGTGCGQDVQRTLAGVLTANGLRAVARGYSHDPLPPGMDLAVEYDSSVQGETRYRGVIWHRVEIKTRVLAGIDDWERVVPKMFDKTNVVLLPPRSWQTVAVLRSGAGDDVPVFRSHATRPQHPTQVRRIVLRAALRAGIDKPVSPHWLRHGHASHALDRGAPIHLVQATLGHASVATTGRYLHARPSISSGAYLEP